MRQKRAQTSTADSAARAQAVLPAFELNEDNISGVIPICRRLDGMPLAIELAAARMSVLSVQQIAARLDNSFQLLRGSRTTLPHDQTLQATIEWSYDLLPEIERVLLGRLSVFSGGWTLEGAEAVVSDTFSLPIEKILDLLAQHEFACDKLQAIAETEHVRARHFDYFLTMAQQGEQSLFAAESSVDWAEAEIDNLRAALTWALETGTAGSPSDERTGRGLELMVYVWQLWLSRGYLSEGNEWMKQLLAAHTASTPARARALLLAGDFARYRGDYIGQEALIQESLALARKLADRKRIAWALMEMGLVERDFRRYPKAIPLLAEGLAMFQELNENLWVCRTSFLLAETYMANGNLEAARPLWERGLAPCREENDKWQIAWGLEGSGNIERLQGRLQQARELYTESLNLKVSVMDRAGITYSLEAFAQLAAAQKQFKRAAVLWGAAEHLRQTLNLLLIPSREQLYTSLISDARAQLGEEIFRAAWAEGQAMKMQQAIDYALN